MVLPLVVFSLKTIQKFASHKNYPYLCTNVNKV